MATKAFSFLDRLDGSRPFNVLARIEVVKTEDGGRDGPFTSQYRPNHNFADPENRSFYIGQINVPEGEWIYPGDTRDLRIEFLGGAGLEDELTLGRKWRIQEGGKLVAIGEILEVERL